METWPGKSGFRVIAPAGRKIVYFQRAKCRKRYGAGVVLLYFLFSVFSWCLHSTLQKFNSRWCKQVVTKIGFHWTVSWQLKLMTDACRQRPLKSLLSIHPSVCYQLSEDWIIISTRPRFLMNSLWQKFSFIFLVDSFRTQGCYNVAITVTVTTRSQ